MDYGFSHFPLIFRTSAHRARHLMLARDGEKKAKCIKRDLRDSDSHLNIFSLYDTVAPVESYTKLLNVILNAPKYISLR